MLLTVVVITTTQYQITAIKDNANPEVLKSDLEHYLDEAHYPEDEDIQVIQNDLKDTLELTDCNILPLVSVFD